MKCTREGCQNKTYWRCSVCNKPVCPEHALVNSDGDIFCSMECKKKGYKRKEEKP
jgi:hypothetical protein